MTRRRFHPLHSKHELFRWNSHCFVTCAPLDLAMHYPWCYIATRKILISNKHIANFGLQIFCPQISSCSTPHPCGFPNICEPNMHVSGPIHRENGYRDLGEQHFQKQPIWVGVGTSVYPLNHPWFEESDLSTRLWSWVLVLILTGMCLHLDVMHVRERSAWGNAAEDMDPCEEIMAPQNTSPELRH